LQTLSLTVYLVYGKSPLFQSSIFGLTFYVLLQLHDYYLSPWGAETRQIMPSIILSWANNFQIEISQLWSTEWSLNLRLYKCTCQCTRLLTRTWLLLVLFCLSTCMLLPVQTT